MSRTKLPLLDTTRCQRIVETLTRPRLEKYLRATKGNEQQALRLYVLNAKVSAAFLTDIHYIEVALRNKFDAELTVGFGSSKWFTVSDFVRLLDPRGQDILKKAQRDAAKGYPKSQPVPTGKVIAELMFGFWLNLTDRRVEHDLWVPFLHKAFLPRTPPRRSVFNNSLEKLRQLRNRVAHHEPIFHMDLVDANKTMRDVADLLCPTTALVMTRTSTVKREVMALSKYRSRQGI